MNQVFPNNTNSSSTNHGMNNTMSSSLLDTDKHKFSTVALSTQPDSLFRMAMLEWEAEHANNNTTTAVPPTTPPSRSKLTRTPSGVFFPVDEDDTANEQSKDMSLREIINMTDDTFLWDDNNNHNNNNNEGSEDAYYHHHMMANSVPSNAMSHMMLMMQQQQQQQQQQHQAAMVTPSSSMHTMTYRRMPTTTTTMAMMQTPMSGMMNSGFPLPGSHGNAASYALSGANTFLANHNHNETTTTTMTMTPTLTTSTSPKKRSRAELLLQDHGYNQEPQDGTNGNQDNNDNDDEEEDGPRFRPYQSGQWYDMFHELCQYKKEHGHVLVPHTYTENLPLARWVKRQRYQYKLLQEGKASSMTPERIDTLQKIGFVWDSQGAAWSERLAELTAFGHEQGHTNVPSNYAANPQLATWVKCQRRQYKLYRHGKPSNMTVQRIQMLQDIGFEWELRGGNKKQKE